MSKALIIMAHGSRNAEANQEFEALVERIRSAEDRSGENGFGQVHAAFLELAEPTLREAAERAVKAGAEELVVYPLFFNRGRHVRSDIPALVEQVREAFPQCRVELLDYFGTAEELAPTVRQHIDRQRSTNS